MEEKQKFDLEVKESKETKEKKLDDRDHWSNSREYFLACLGYAVGLGNVWRFPYLCFQNGGGAFLIPYATIAILVGLPMMFLELAIGQFMKRGPLHTYNLVPAMKGIGYASVVIIAYSSLYYIVILAWGVFYFFHSFTTGELPWTTCDNWWNSENCVTFQTTSVVNNTNISTATDDVNKNESVLAVEEFWNNYVIRKSIGIEEIGSITNWKLMLSLLFAWVICYFCIFKGVKLTGKVVYVTALLPYILLLILAVRGCTLEGASQGIKFYLFPNFTKLGETDVWIQAANQVFYGYGIVCAVLISLASYNDFHTNCLRNSVALAITGSGASLLAGLGVFSVLGHMAFVTGKQVSEVVDSGPGLAFQAFPTALSLMPVAKFWCILFFFMIIIIGIDSQFAFVEAIVCALGDIWPSLAFKLGTREWIVLALCVAFAVLGIPFTFGCGIYIFGLFDSYSVTGFCMFSLVLCEAVTFGYIYGMDRFYDDLKLMLGYSPTRFFKFSFMFFTPFCSTIFLVLSITSYTPLTIKGYFYPSWGYAIGWLMSLSSVVLVPLTIFSHMWRQNGSILKKWKKATMPIYPDHVLQKQQKRAKEFTILTSNY